MRFRIAALLCAAVVGGVGLLVWPGLPAGAGGPRRVEVTLRFSSFRPGLLHAKAGETVRFVVRNVDPIDHEFLLGDKTRQDAHERGTESHHGARPGELSVPAGETRVTTYTFTKPGTLLLGCHLPTHWDYGMRGVVRVR